MDPFTGRLQGGLINSPNDCYSYFQSIYTFRRPTDDCYFHTPFVRSNKAIPDLRHSINKDNVGDLFMGFVRCQFPENKYN